LKEWVLKKTFCPQRQPSSAHSICIIERAESALINAVEGQEGMPAGALWMVREPA